MTSQKASGERSGETYRYVKLLRWLNIPISRDLISLDLKLLLRNEKHVFAWQNIATEFR